MLKVSILGSNGFIGSNLAKQSAVEDTSITIFGRSAPTEPPENCEFIKGDFADPDQLKKALEGQDIVYHLISQTIPSTSWNDPLKEVEKNLLPTLRFFEIAAKCGVKKICLASSGGTVYGLQENHLSEVSLTEPFSPYGIIKRTIESFLQHAKINGGMNYDIYRISNVYGEGQDIGKGLGFINTALENIVHGRPVVIYGDGENVRDYIYVKDVAKFLSLSTVKNLGDSDIYNVSSNHPISLNELISLIRNVLGIDFEVKYQPGRMSDNRKVILDNSKIMKKFENLEIVSLENGIRSTYSYLNSKKTHYV